MSSHIDFKIHKVPIFYLDLDGEDRIKMGEYWEMRCRWAGSTEPLGLKKPWQPLM